MGAEAVSELPAGSKTSNIVKVLNCGRWTMSTISLKKAALLGSVLYIPLAFATAKAADLIIMSPEPMAEQYVDLTLPAVSGPNGKVEIDFGGLSDPSSAIFRAGASVSLPIGERFGIQGDLAVGSFADEWMAGGALHVFTRDPNAYLLGVTAGVVVADGATLAAIGPEAELYLDRLSLEGWAGWAKVDYDSMPDDDGVFGMFDLAYYPTDDWRVSIGVSSILGAESFKLATEYQFGDFGIPMSATGEVRAYDTDSWSAKIGLKGYFGEPGKSLIDRHRQDDPPNRVIDLFAAAGNVVTADTPEDVDPELCPEGYYYDGEGCVPDGEGPF
jgi:hypothetical protein